MFSLRLLKALDGGGTACDLSQSQQARNIRAASFVQSQLGFPALRNKKVPGILASWFVFSTLGSNEESGKVAFASVGERDDGDEGFSSGAQKEFREVMGSDPSFLLPFSTSITAENASPSKSSRESRVHKSSFYTSNRSRMTESHDGRDACCCHGANSKLDEGYGRPD